MSEPRKERVDLLADVAELYYLEGKTQAQIARRVGVTRSMVSRMLNEARTHGIVEIKIRRSLIFNHELQSALMERFQLAEVYIVDVQSGNYEKLLQNIGMAGAIILKRLIKPGMTLGLPWGTTVAAVIDEIEEDRAIPVKIVQLVGALGSRNMKYDSHAIVENLARKLGGEAYYLNAPFLVETKEIVHAFLSSASIKDVFLMGQKCDIALLGLGSTDLEYSSYYQAGYLTREDVNQLRDLGAVGSVCGIHYDVQGDIRAKEFQKRILSIDEDALLSIPLRIGVAGGPGKVKPLLGAIRGGFINVLVTDCWTALDLIELDSSF